MNIWVNSGEFDRCGNTRLSATTFKTPSSPSCTARKISAMPPVASSPTSRYLPNRSPASGMDSPASSSSGSDAQIEISGFEGSSRLRVSSSVIAITRQLLDAVDRCTGKDHDQDYAWHHQSSLHVLFSCS